MKKTCECGGTVTADPRVFDRAWAHHQETCPAKPPAKVKEKVG